MKGTYENNILLLLIFQWVAQVEEKWFLIIRVILTTFGWKLYQLVYDTGYYNKELNRDSKHKRMRFCFSCLLREKKDWPLRFIRPICLIISINQDSTFLCSVLTTPCFPICGLRWIFPSWHFPPWLLAASTMTFFQRTGSGKVKREGASFLFNDDDDSSIAHNMLASPIGQHVLIKLQRILENVVFSYILFVLGKSSIITQETKPPYWNKWQFCHRSHICSYCLISLLWTP